MSVAFTLKREQVDEVQARVFGQINTIIEDIIEAFLDEGGLVFGQVELEREERVLKVVDLAQRGVLEALQQIAPHHYDDILKQFAEDVEALEAANVAT